MDITDDTTVTKVTKKRKKASASATLSNLTLIENPKKLRSTNITVLKEALITFFKSRSNFSLSSTNEAVLQAVTELLLPNN